MGRFVCRAGWFLLVVMIGSATVNGADPGPWATYRGNPQRTGNTDNQPGPATPAVQWLAKSQDHYIAAPVPVGTSIYLSGLGAFNRPTITLFPMNGTGEPKAVWSRSAPYLRFASVSSPAVSGNTIVFGDGMHQDAGGIRGGVASLRDRVVDE